MAMAARTVLILGAGVGGVVAASLLRRELAPEDRVTLVDARSAHEFRPTLLPVAAGLMGAEQARRGFAGLARQGVEIVSGVVTRIAPDRRAAVVAGTERTADALIVALGAATAPERIPGLAQIGCDLYALSGAQEAARRVGAMHRGRIAVTVPAGQCSCPLAPYEYAMLVESGLRVRGLRDHVELSLYTAETAPLPAAGPAVAAAMREWLLGRGIAFLPGLPLERVDPAARTLTFTGGLCAPFDVLIAVPPHEAPPAILDSPLAGPLGWAPVDIHTCETGFPNVFVLGDAAALSLPSGHFLPKQGVFAHWQARAVARTVAARLRRGGPEGHFDGEGEIFIETGDGAAAVVCARFYDRPAPTVLVMHPTPHWHAAHVAVGQGWWRAWFPDSEAPAVSP